MVKEDTEVDRILWSLAGGASEHEHIKVARESGVPVLDGNDVIRDLPEQMAPEAEEILREEISHIQAARQDKVVILDHRCPTGYRTVPIEELTAEDVSEWFLSTLEDLASNPPLPFIIPPTEPVLAYLAAHGERTEDCA